MNEKKKEIYVRKGGFRHELSVTSVYANSKLKYLTAVLVCMCTHLYQQI